MSAPTLDLQLDGRRFHPGDTITGRAMIGDGTKRHPVQVDLVCLNSHNTPSQPSTLIGMLASGATGDAGNHEGVTTEIVVASSQLPNVQGAQRFALTLPTDAAVSAFDPELPPNLRRLVAWEVRLHCVRSRLLGTSHVVSRGFDVYPLPGQYAEWAQQPAVTGSPDCPVELQLDTRTVSPGDRLTGRLTVTPKKAMRVKHVRVHLARRRFDYLAAGQTKHPISSNSNGRPWRKPLELSGPTEFAPGQTYSYPFEFKLPAKTAPSFVAPHNELHWLVVGTVDRGLHKNYEGELEFVVHTTAPPTARPTPGAHDAVIAPPAFGAPAAFSPPSGLPAPAAFSAPPAFSPPPAPSVPSVVMEIHDVFRITGKGTVVTGELEHDVHVGDRVEIAGLGRSVVDGIQLHKKLVQEAGIGDEAGLLLKDLDIKRSDRGAQVVLVS